LNKRRPRPRILEGAENQREKGMVSVRGERERRKEEEGPGANIQIRFQCTYDEERGG
jgi:hypothetical protein